MNKITIVKTLWIVNTVIMLSACGGGGGGSNDGSPRSNEASNNPNNNLSSSNSDSEVRLKQITEYDSNNKVIQKNIFNYDAKNRLSINYHYKKVDNRANTGLYLASEDKTEYVGNKKIKTGKEFNKNELIIRTYSEIHFNIKKDGKYNYDLFERKEIDKNGLEKSSLSLKFTPLTWKKNSEIKTKIEETRIDAFKKETKKIYYFVIEEKQTEPYQTEHKLYNEKEELLTDPVTCEYDSKGHINPYQYLMNPLYRKTTLIGIFQIGCSITGTPIDTRTTIEEINNDGLITKTKTTNKGAFVYYTVYEYTN